MVGQNITGKEFHLQKRGIVFGNANSTFDFGKKSDWLSIKPVKVEEPKKCHELRAKDERDQ